jgi:hypothetical protein
MKPFKSNGSSEKVILENNELGVKRMKLLVTMRSWLTTCCAVRVYYAIQELPHNPSSFLEQEKPCILTQGL